MSLANNLKGSCSIDLLGLSVASQSPVASRSTMSTFYQLFIKGQAFSYFFITFFLLIYTYTHGQKTKIY